MKRSMFTMVTLSLLLLAAFANDKKTDSKDSMGKDATVSGWVTDPVCAKGKDKSMLANGSCAKKCAKDGKLVLVTDGDNKVWAVTNSEALKGHEGHHVKVTGHPDADTGTIHVVTVAMLDDQTPPGAMKQEMKADHKK